MALNASMGLPLASALARSSPWFSRVPNATLHAVSKPSTAMMMANAAQPVRPCSHWPVNFQVNQLTTGTTMTVTPL